MTGITVVQAAYSPDVNGSATLGSGLTSGNTLLLIAADYAVGFTAGEPSQFTIGGTAYTVPAAFLGEVSPGTNTIAYSAWLVPVTAGMAGATSLSFTVVGSGPLKLYGIELSAGAVITLDQSLAATATGTAAYSSGTVTTAQGNELAVFTVAGFNSVPSSGVPGAPWTEVVTSSEMPLWYRNGVSSGTPLAFSGSMTATADWASALFTLYAAGGAVPSGLLMVSVV